jgi:selenocysteine lyase/cysteine desulfurase
MLDFIKARTETPGSATKTHFNNAGASLMPKAVIASIQDYISFEANTGGYETEDIKRDEISGFYKALAKLINCKPENIAFTSSATNSFARALSSIPFHQRDSILIANEDYISNQLAFLSLQKRFGITILRAASSIHGGVDMVDMERLMDIHKPKLVSLTHVPTNSGLIQPIEEVGKLCRERGILYLVDACQSAGQLPLDVNKIQCDFLSATFRKFLRGPRGAGFLFIADRVLEQGLEPLFIDMRGAHWTAANEYVPQRDAKRFEDWEFPYALLVGAKVSVEYALNIGINNIEERNNLLCKKIRNEASLLPGIKVLDIGKKLSSIITLKIPGWQPNDFMEALRKKNINTSISYREYGLIDFSSKGVDWALRVSPHYFNTEEEIDILIQALRETKI